MARRVLVPLDRSPRAEDALDVLPSICEAGDEVILLSIAAPEHQTQTGLRPGRVVVAGAGAGFTRADLPTYADTTDQAAQRQLDELETYLVPKSRALETKGFKVSTAFELSDDPAEAIVDVARKCQPTFIVMTRTTHPGIAERVFGTVAQQVIREGVAPVMILPGS